MPETQSICSCPRSLSCLVAPFRRCNILLLLLFSIPVLLHAQTELQLERIVYNDTSILESAAIEAELEQQQYLRLPSVKELEFELACCPLADQEQLYYVMRGFDDDWNISRSTTLRYTNLPQGEYYLLVKRDMESAERLRVDISVAPPTVTRMQDQWWFQPLLTFCLLLIPFTLLYFLSLDRSRRSLRLEVVRNQIASDLHDDIGANLGAIKNLAELLNKKSEKAEPASLQKVIGKIRTYTQDTITNLQDTVWAINPLNDSVEDLLEKMREFALLMLTAKDIEVRFRNDFDPALPQKLDMQQRHSMFVMFKEIINNIVKHAEATAVDIHIRNTSDQLVIDIQDNGKGFDPEQLYRGNGLKNFQHRAGEHFIDFDLHSEIGKGTAAHMVVHNMQ